MNDLIERMAKAAFEQVVERGFLHGYDGPLMTWDGESEALRDDWRACMRAALKEVRDLPDLAGPRFNDYRPGSHSIAHIWRAIVDEATK